MNTRRLVAVLGSAYVGWSQPACEKPDLTVENVSVTWTGTTKSVSARIGNSGSADAGGFSVRFTADEFPATGPLPPVTRSLPSLDNGSDVTITADFTPLQQAANNNLWNVRRIVVVADPDNAVTEKRDNNNEAARNVLNSDFPIVIINTNGQTLVNEPKKPTAARIIDDQTPAHNYNGVFGVEIRGASSASFCKKQYAVETWNAANNDVDVPLLGLPAEEDWILNGPYSDKTLIRNHLAYTISNALGRYASRTKFVEAFLNDPGLSGVPNCPTPPLDAYVGVYVLMEKIKRDASRVAITKLAATDNAEPAITGGYILKIDWFDPGDLRFTTTAGTTITYVEPAGSTDPAQNEITPQQQTWVRTYMNDFETALNGANFADPVNGYAKYIDVPSFVDFFIINEFFKNFDAFRASTYMHKDRNGKLHMGPVWDFDLSLGNGVDAVGTGRSAPTGWIRGANSGQPFWWNRLLQDPAFVQQVNARWTALRANVLAQSSVHAMVDGVASQLAASQQRNFARWPIMGTRVFGNPPNPSPTESYASVIQDVKTWIAARLIWMDQNLPLLP